MRLIMGKQEKRSSKRGRDCNGHHPELRHCRNNLLLPYCSPVLLPFVPVVRCWPVPPCHLWQGDRNTVLLAKPYGLFYFPYCPFLCFLPPLMCFFHSSIWDPLFLNGKFISVDGYERVPVFALCPEKNNAGRLRCPQHFLPSKTFLNPSFLIVVCRKKRLINSDGAWKLKKKVGRKKRPSRKGVLKKGL